MRCCCDPSRSRSATAGLLRTSGPPDKTGTIDTEESFSYPVYDALRRQSRALSDVIAVAQLSVDKVNVRIDALPEEAEADMVSGNFFSGLGASWRAVAASPCKTKPITPW